LSPAEGREWEPDDLHSFTDEVDYAAQPLGRTVQVTGRGPTPIERHVAVMSVGRLEEIEAPDPGHEPWLAHTDRLPFPVEWSAQFDILSGGEARQAIQRKLLVVRDMQRHYREHDLDEPLALDRQARQARQVEDQMSRGVDVSAARLHGWFRLAVSARTEEECLEKVRKVTSSYRGRRVSIEHPRGQYSLLREFIPGEPVSTSAYRRRLPVLYFAAGVPTASSQVGDRRGPYVGFTAGSSRRAVMFDTHYATEVKETSGLVPVVGGLGAGKSVLLGQITYEAVRRGIPSVVLDPSGPLARLTELPEFREHAEHIDLTTAHSGTLNPFEVVAKPSRRAYESEDAFTEAEVLAAQDRKLLAMDVVKMLLPPSLDAIPQTSLVVSDAVRATHGSPESSLWDVVNNLESLEEQHGRVVANYLRDMAELPLARLFFPSGQRHGERLDATLTVLTMPGLVLPPRNVPRDHWSTSEQLAVPLLHLASWYATRAVYGRRMASRKLVALDETHFLGEWSAGRALFTRLGRDSRKWNTCVLAASQNPADVLGMDVANFMSAAFVGRIEDDDAARDGLRMLRVPTGVGYERALATLSAGRGTAGFREFVMRDVDGHVDKIRVDLSANPSLLEALNTTAGADQGVQVA
ncbi:MAG TPA: ATP-binding protein, partial [Nocardioidaceae bacterium]|nr:ATP-binding protein [Nocardioidaceae bacterium]